MLFSLRSTKNDFHAAATQRTSARTDRTAYATLLVLMLSGATAFANNHHHHLINQVRITTSSLPSGTIGTAYTTSLAATDGTSPYTWTVSSGSLPAGLS